MDSEGGAVAKVSQRCNDSRIDPIQVLPSKLAVLPGKRTGTQETGLSTNQAALQKWYY